VPPPSTRAQQALSHTSNVTENLFEWVSNKRNNDQCFDPATMWMDLENVIAFVGGALTSRCRQSAGCSTALSLPVD
jgi:hypothetical protein